MKRASRETRNFRRGLQAASVIRENENKEFHRSSLKIFSHERISARLPDVPEGNCEIISNVLFQIGWCHWRREKGFEIYWKRCIQGFFSLPTLINHLWSSDRQWGSSGSDVQHFGFKKAVFFVVINFEEVSWFFSTMMLQNFWINPF